jgi:hypothetical protein
MSKSNKVVRVELSASDIAEIQEALGAVFIRRLELAGSREKYREMYGSTIFTALEHKMADALRKLRVKTLND